MALPPARHTAAVAHRAGGHVLREHVDPGARARLALPPKVIACNGKRPARSQGKSAMATQRIAGCHAAARG